MIIAAQRYAVVSVQFHFGPTMKRHHVMHFQVFASSARCTLGIVSEKRPSERFPFRRSLRLCRTDTCAKQVDYASQQTHFGFRSCHNSLERSKHVTHNQMHSGTRSTFNVGCCVDPRSIRVHKQIQVQISQCRNSCVPCLDVRPMALRHPFIDAVEDLVASINLPAYVFQVAQSLV